MIHQKLCVVSVSIVGIMLIAYIGENEGECHCVHLCQEILGIGLQLCVERGEEERNMRLFIMPS